MAAARRPAISFPPVHNHPPKIFSSHCPICGPRVQDYGEVCSTCKALHRTLPHDARLSIFDAFDRLLAVYTADFTTTMARIMKLEPISTAAPRDTTGLVTLPQGNNDLSPLRVTFEDQAEYELALADAAEYRSEGMRLSQIMDMSRWVFRLHAYRHKPGGCVAWNACIARYILRELFNRLADLSIPSTEPRYVIPTAKPHYLYLLYCPPGTS